MSPSTHSVREGVAPAALLLEGATRAPVIARKETRGLHNRPDYPLTDPVLDGKAIFVRQVDGKPLMEWRKTE